MWRLTMVGGVLEHPGAPASLHTVVLIENTHEDNHSKAEG